MENEEIATPISSGEGERRAQRGLVPQYKVAAEKILGLLESGRLFEIAIADPEAETLDDFQTVRRDGGRLVLDAYQVKWSKPGKTLTDSEFRTLLSEMVSGRGALQLASEARAASGDEPVARVVAHLYSNRGASTASFRGSDPGGNRLGRDGQNLQSFLSAVWNPAQRGALTTIDEVDVAWHPYLRVLAEACDLSPEGLLILAPDLRVQLDRELEGDDPDDTWKSRDRHQDLQDVRLALQDLVTDRDRDLVRVSVDDLVQKLGPIWTRRWRPRQEHVFALDRLYEPSKASESALLTALTSYGSGYVVLTGSPGSGKSTLLTRLLRNDERLAARYYAYVPGGSSVARGEAGSFLRDLYLELTNREGRHTLPPRGDALDALKDAFRDALKSLGERAVRAGRTEIVLVDGLDHVGRAPHPSHPLLSELPTAEEVPEGVLFVLGTRALSDLPAHVRATAKGGRHVQLEPLDRAATIRLCVHGGVPTMGDRIAKLSSGHPLLAQTYIRLAALEPNEVGQRLALERFAPVEGDIWDFYEGIWLDIAADPDLVQVLAIVCRLRNAIRGGWLVATGTRIADLERLQRLAYLFDTRDHERWFFFHSSFREFVLGRTAEFDGELSADIDAQLHHELAKRCRDSPADAPERFDEIHHLISARAWQEVITRATPEYFREQVDQLRPADSVEADIRASAVALIHVQDGMGAAKLAIAAHELQVRGYQFPRDDNFVDLLVALGLSDYAIAQVRSIDNGTVGDDRLATAMRLAQQLDAAGHPRSALRVFDEHEPLDWFGGPPAAIDSASAGPLSGLYGWSRAAAQLRGADYVMDTIDRLHPPAPPGRFDPSLEDLPATLLWFAADQFVALGQTPDAVSIRQRLIEMGTQDALAFVARIDLRLAVKRADEELSSALRLIDPLLLGTLDRITFGEALVRADLPEEARRAADTIEAPSPPDGRAFNHDADDWASYYRYLRLRAAIDGPADPSRVVLSGEKKRASVFAARHLINIANLEACQQTRSVATSEVLAALRSMHAWQDSLKDTDPDEWPPLDAMALATRRAIAMASRNGHQGTAELVAYFVERWRLNPRALRTDGPALVADLARAGGGRLSLSAALADLEQAMSDTGAPPWDWVELGPAWLALDSVRDAGRVLRHAVRRTLSLSSSKDTQLEMWIRLMTPLLRGPNGGGLCDRLTDALAVVRMQQPDSAPERAARTLFDSVAREDFAEGWRLAQAFFDTGLLDTLEVVEAMLEAGAGRPTPTWWIATAEIAVTLGGRALAEAIQLAVHADETLARAWLPRVAQRVSAEGRPTERVAWRAALSEAAQGLGLPSEELGIAPGDLVLSNETPASSSARRADPPADRSDDSLIAQAEDPAQPENSRYEAVRELSRRTDRLSLETTRRLITCSLGSDRECLVRSSLAVAIARDDPDEAWEQGVAALTVSSSTDWSRSWAGGPILKVVPVLLGLDAQRARSLIFKRFAELADEVDYFLASVGQSLEDYVGLLELPPLELAECALEAATTVLRDAGDLAGPREPRPQTSSGIVEADGSAPLQELVMHLLGREQTHVWQAAQRAACALVEASPGIDFLATALSRDSETALRTCAVIVVQSEYLRDQDALLEPLRKLVAHRRLDVRWGAVKCLQALKWDLPFTPDHRPLPPALRIAVAPRDDRRIVTDDLEAKLGVFHPPLGEIAHISGVDELALRAFVFQKAASKLDGVADIDKLPRAERHLGWGYVRPGARALRQGLAEIGADLLDAGRVFPLEALEALSLYPVFDPTLLRRRPERRPAAVRAFVEDQRRGDFYGTDIQDVPSGEARPAVAHDGWVVIGEHSELALLDRLRFGQIRRSGVLPGGSRGEEGPYASVREALTVVDYSHLAAGSRAQFGVAYCWSAPAASPTGWLALSPTLAHQLGLERSESDELGWTLDGRAAVQSLWWRSGYLKWNPYSERDEVGEGWLVLASPELAARLQDQGWRLRYEITTTRHGDGHVPADEFQTDGWRNLVEPPSAG